MGYTNYISESEAMHVCGVSAKTLSRFAEAGYLSIEKESDGLRMYSARELEQVFGGVATSRLRKKRQESTNLPKNSVSPEIPTSHEDEARRAAKEKEVVGDEVEQAAPVLNIEQRSEREEVTPSELRTESLSNPPEDPSETPQLPKMPRPHTEDSKLLELSEKLSHLQRVQEVNEKIIELREERIRELTQERDWLRIRVERLEEKAERDQLLLLSETQIVRQMLDHQQRSSSPVRAALEWIGILEPRRQPKFTKEDVLISGPNKS